MNGERLKAARRMAGLSLEELAQKAGEITKQAISNYETGKRQPDSKTILRLAKLLDVRPEYFLQKDKIRFDAFEYRKKAKLGEKAKDVIEEKSRYVAERYLEIESLLGFTDKWENPLQKLEIKTGADVEKAALELRKKWNLGTAAIIKLIETLETCGIMIISVEADDNFDGLTNFANGKPIIIYNEKIKDNVRIRFTIAHELAHILLNLNSVDSSKNRETLCHRFAGAFLLPEEKIYQELGSRQRRKTAINELISIKEEYGISIQVIAKRLHYLGIITDASYKYFNIMVNKNKWKINELGEFKISEEPERFRNLVMRAVAEEIITISKAASLLNTSISKLENTVKFVI